MARGFAGLCAPLLLWTVCAFAPAPAEAQTECGEGPTVTIDSASAVEGDSGTQALLIRVFAKCGQSGVPVTVECCDVVTELSTATRGEDFEFTPQVFTFNSPTGEVGESELFTVAIVGDGIKENDEEFALAFRQATNQAGDPIPINAATPAPGTIVNGNARNGYTVILDQDPYPVATLSTDDLGEGASGTRDLLFVATLDRPSELATSIDYRIGGGTAMVGEDYEEPLTASGTLTFGPVRSPNMPTVWETEKLVIVKVIGDTVVEGNETVEIEYSNFQGIFREVGEETQRVEATIFNDDHTLSISSPAIGEGPTGMTATLNYVVRLIPSSYEDVTVEFFMEGTAESGVDFTLPQNSPINIQSGPIEFTIAAGDTRLDVPVSVTGDDMVEEDETLTVLLSNPEGPPESTITFVEGQDEGTGTIRNDDHEIWITDAQDVFEGDDGASTNLVYRVGLEPPSTGAVILSYSVSSGSTAMAGEDYTDPSGMLEITPGDIASSIEIEVTGDGDPEPDETVEVALLGATGPAGSTVTVRSGMAMASGSVLDDEVPTFSISSDGVDESDAGVERMVYTVAVYPAPSEPVTVSYEVTGGTATAGVDYWPLQSGMLEFRAGDRSKTLEVLVRGDGVPEPDETVMVTLFGQTTGTRLRQASASAVIRNDDAPTVSVSSPSVAEGNAGDSARLQFVVSLSAASTQTVTVDYSIADGTATLDEDYRATLTGTVTFMPGDAEGEVVVSVIGDAVAESDETVEVALSNPTNARLGTVIGTGSILDDDQPLLSISSPSVDEGAAGERTDLEFLVTLSIAAPQRVSVAYAVSGGTAREGQDYQVLPAGSLVFSAGESEKTVAITVMGDGSAEADETVEIALSSPLGAGIRQAVGTGTIRSDDNPAFSIDSPSAVEPTGDRHASLVYTVRLDPASSQAVSVGYRVTGGTATSGDDYQPLAAGRLEFAANERAQTIRVRVLGDMGFEEQETIILALSGPSNGTVIAAGRGVGTGVVTEDAVSPTFSANSPRVQEGGEGDETLVRFNVGLSKFLDYAVSVDYRVTSPDNVALAGMDDDGEAPALPSGTLTYGAGTTRLVLLLYIAGNDTAEGNRRLVLALSNPQAVDAGQGQVAPEIRRESGTGVLGGTATILDDDRVEREPGFTYALAGFGRSVATGIVGALWDRAESHRTAGGKFLAMAGGRDVDAGALTSGDAGRAAREAAGLLGVHVVPLEALAEDMEEGRAISGGFDAWRSHAGLPDMRGLMNGSRFALSLDGDSDDGGPGNLTFWGQGRTSSYASDIDDETYSTFASEGDVTARYLGFDYRLREDVLYGVALSRTTGSTAYGFERVSNGTGEAEFSLTTATPYIHLISVTDFAVWLAAGIGQGTATVKDPVGEAETDISLLMAAIGMRAGATGVGSFEMAAKADGFAAELSADGASGPDGNAALEEVDSTAYRVRGAVEGVSRGVSEGGGASTARFDLGARLDGGSGESGFGADIGIKLGYANPNSGVELAARGDVLLFHTQDGFSEWSAGLGLGYAPPPRDRGFQISVGPAWNGPPPELDAAMAGNFQDRGASRNRGVETQLRLAYGVDAMRGRMLVTAYGEMEGDGGREGNRRLRLGVDSRELHAGIGRVRLKVFGQREERGRELPEHAVVLEGTLGF